MTEAEFKRDFPLDEYKDEADNRTWKEGSSSYQKTFRTANDKLLEIPASAFPRNGWYVATITTKDPSGTLLTEKKYIQIYDAALSGMPTTSLLIVEDGETVLQPGVTVPVYVLSAYKNAHIIMGEQRMDGSNLQQFSLDGKLKQTIPLTDADRGGLMRSYVTVKNNRVYQDGLTLNIPWTNKELKIDWATHRDKTLPGTEETWTVTISGDKKDKVAAEMMATLYDASLDKLKGHYWGMNGLQPGLSYYGVSFNAGAGFGLGSHSTLSTVSIGTYISFTKEYPELIEFGGMNRQYMLSDVMDPVTGESLSVVTTRSRSMAAPMGSAGNKSMKLEEAEKMDGVF